MKLTWFGHAFFLMESTGGTRIATDPFDPPIGYPMPSFAADAVAVSHAHHDHAYIDCLHGNEVVIEHLTGTVRIKDVTITAYPSFHDKNQGAQRGANTMYVFEIDGLRVAHLGDLGHLLSPDTLSKIGAIDVLLLPVGGFYTINAAEAVQTAKALQATCVIPMHYKTPHLTFELAKVDDFLALVEVPVAYAGNAVILDKFNLKKGVLVMDYQ